MTDERQERAMTQPDVRQQIADALEDWLDYEKSLMEFSALCASDVDAIREHIGLIASNAAHAALSLLQQQEAELARLSAELRQMKWQPIKTAPYDTELITVGSVFGPSVAIRRKGDDWWAIPIKEWLVIQPTHWMPLPAPPRAPEGREG